MGTTNMVKLRSNFKRVLALVALSFSFFICLEKSGQFESLSILNVVDVWRGATNSELKTAGFQSGPVAQLVRAHA